MSVWSISVSVKELGVETGLFSPFLSPDTQHKCSVDKN